MLLSRRAAVPPSSPHPPAILIPSYHHPWGWCALNFAPTQPRCSGPVRRRDESLAAEPRVGAAPTTDAAILENDTAGLDAPPGQHRCGKQGPRRLEAEAASRPDRSRAANLGPVTGPTPVGPPNPPDRRRGRRAVVPIHVLAPRRLPRKGERE